MTKQDYILVEKLWGRLTGTKFVPLAFAQLIRRHGGHDMSNLRDEDVLQLLVGEFAGNWHDPVFSFSELLAYYSAPDEKRTNEEIVGWVFASLVIADAIKQGATDWEMEFNKFINCFVEVRSKLETDEAVEIFQRVFHRDPVLEQSRST
jgi:hypothetical protein